MTVSVDTSIVTYIGDGNTTLFGVPFYFLDVTHLNVLLRSAIGIETTLTYGTDYTATIDTSIGGGMVTVFAPPPTDAVLAITRNVPLTQETHYMANDPFPAKTHELALDKLTMEIQQVSEAVSRAVKVQVTDNTLSSDALVSALQNSAILTQQLYTSFQNTYYGTYATAPTLDPSGNAINVGDMYYNTTLQSLQIYTSTGWQATAQATPTSYTSQTFSGTGAQTAFTLSAAPASIVATEVFISGVRQRPTTDYTLSGTTLTFLSAPAAGTNNIFIRWTYAIAVGVPNDGSVTTAKLATGAVTNSTIAAGAVTNSSLSLTTVGIFSNNTNPATTAFVQRALGNFSTTASYTATATQNNTDAGKLTLVTSSSAFTLTLPPTALLLAGATFTYYNSGTGIVTLALSSGTFLGTSATGYTLYPNTTVSAVWNGTNWILKSANWYTIGYNQTWQDVSASRTINTNYTNTSGRPIQVTCVLQDLAGGSPTVDGQTVPLLVGGVVADYFTDRGGVSQNVKVQGIIPIGATYSVTLSSGSATILKWSELR